MDLPAAWSKIKSAHLQLHRPRRVLGYSLGGGFLDLPVNGQQANLDFGGKLLKANPERWQSG
jgi:hypothetical protein